MYGFIYFPEDAKFKSESLLTNLELIHKFNKYFLHETEADIQRMMAQDFNLKKNKGNLFTEDDKNNPLFRSNQNVNSFFQSISRLTPREEECLQLFQQGYSAQASAAILGISRRTVEHHINHIKEKYKCYSKWELLNK
jgi:DNA-binding CsgD family transcriptional regulator